MNFFERFRSRRPKDLTVRQNAEPLDVSSLARDPLLSAEAEDNLKVLDLHIKNLSELYGFTEEYLIGDEKIVLKRIGLKYGDKSFDASFGLSALNARTSITTEAYQHTPPARYFHSMESLAINPPTGYEGYTFKEIRPQDKPQDRPVLTVEEAEGMVQELLSSAADPDLTQDMWNKADGAGKYVRAYRKYWNSSNR